MRTIRKNTSLTLRRIRMAYLFFFIAALYGFMMRWQKYTPVFSVKFNHVLQAHSHTAFLGWGVLSVLTLISFVFIEKEERRRAVYKYPFILMSISLLGMYVSFPVQGYKLFSIVFLSVFLFASYVFLGGLYKYLSVNATLPAKYIRSGILFYYLSSMGIWGLSVIAVKLGKGDMYKHAISFYTHFLYNGFFVLVLWGLFFKVYEKAFKPYDALLRRILPWLNYAVLLSFALSLLWKPMPWYVHFFAATGATIQVVIAIIFVWKIRNKNELYRQMTGLKKWIWCFLCYAFGLKIFLQWIGAYAPVTQIAMKYKTYFVIGYIHLFTLAFMSMFIVLLTFVILKVKLQKTSLILLIYGIIGTEFLLFSQGILLLVNDTGIRRFDALMWIISSLLILGIGGIFRTLLNNTDYPKD